MIWTMRNHAKFQQSINLDSTIHIIKGYIKLSGNCCEKSINNDMDDFSILKLFDIQARPRQGTRTIQVIYFTYLVIHN